MRHPTSENRRRPAVIRVEAHFLARFLVLVTPFQPLSPDLVGKAYS
jgi:hypothetical protein